MATTTNKSPTRLVITSGEPAGIGPDICLQLADTAKFDDSELYILADPDLLVQRAAQLKLTPALYIHHNIEHLGKYYQPGKLNVIPLALNAKYAAPIRTKIPAIAKTLLYTILDSFVIVV